MTPPGRAGRRHFVYFLSAASGELLYIGRSVDVVARLKGHYREASEINMQAPRKALWLMDVTRVDMIGPFTFAEADLRERALIQFAQTYGNLALNPLTRSLGRHATRVNAERQAVA